MWVSHYVIFTSLWMSPSCSANPTMWVTVFLPSSAWLCTVHKYKEGWNTRNNSFFKLCPTLLSTKQQQTSWYWNNLRDVSKFLRSAVFASLNIINTHWQKKDNLVHDIGDDKSILLGKELISTLHLARKWKSAQNQPRAHKPGLGKPLVCFDHGDPIHFEN
jgi:hypothetical protein